MKKKRTEEDKKEGLIGKRVWNKNSHKQKKPSFFFVKQRINAPSFLKVYQGIKKYSDLLCY